MFLLLEYWQKKQMSPTSKMSKTKWSNIISHIICRQLSHLITDVGDTEIMLSGAYSWVKWFHWFRPFFLYLIDLATYHPPSQPTRWGTGSGGKLLNMWKLKKVESFIHFQLILNTKIGLHATNPTPTHQPHNKIFEEFSA